ncbi:unnamed protein product [Caenorhabditis angaria]|uniref:Ubiquinone biosynthesis O-methyltransferase, mitochondrial n=1 Tax=Caenorhabditis angaria TaxID=860376 RepID=A0A9P1N1X1_9PELO|nr:unnamed protein product [Caenorhabditis angaria]
MQKVFRRFHQTSVDLKEIANFGKLSTEWADELGPFQALHSLNRLRVPWIVQNLKGQKSPKLVDVGSGGGLLSIPLARSGIQVTGIDATKEAVEAATKSLKSKPLKLTGVSQNCRFLHTTVEEFSAKPENREKFDAVVASEIVEHVADLAGFVKSLADLARPGAPIFLTTINRTLASKVAAIWLAEDLLRLVPPGVHDWNKFPTPAELETHLKSANCQVSAISGLFFHPIGNHWTWIDSNLCNYAILAHKL